MAKRMRLPNGFGQISELKGRRLRNKWRAMVTIGWTVDGKPKRKILGYYHTYNDAYMSLMKYHENLRITLLKLVTTSNLTGIHRTMPDQHL